MSGDHYDESITLGHLIRALSQDRQVPFLNYQHAMWSLPNHGLGGDNVHPTYVEYNRIAWFNPEDLDYGYNLRNLLSLEALQRMYESRVATPGPLDSEPAGYLGSGTLADPFIIDELAFVHTGFLSTVTPSVYYRYDSNYGFGFRAMATSQGESGIHVELLDASMQPIATGSVWAENWLSPGTYYVRILPEGTPQQTGEAYQFVAMDTDIQMPTVPQNFTVSSANGTVTLNWSASSDNQAVAGYRVFRNGRTYATTPELWFVDTDVVSGQEYVYSVSAFDRADIESYHSTLSHIVVQGEQPPVNHPPILAQVGNQTIRVGQPVQFTIQASDEDPGSILEYAAAGTN
ncbi:MAG: Exoglucanase B precursor [Verrucomicrobia bacterium ADurb.Bin474]|nr:MAG: Exoglucanase B precursor [Verrucomicrobia bacterium ADurb.Bin474]